MSGFIGGCSGYSLTGRRRTDPKLEPVVRSRVVAALREGRSNSWIIDNIGTCRTTITRLVKKFKIQRQPGRQKKHD